MSVHNIQYITNNVKFGNDKNVAHEPQAAVSLKFLFTPF